MKILVTGGTGLLGKALIDTVPAGYTIVATYLADCAVKDTQRVLYEKLDVRDKDACRRLYDKVEPSVTVHAAGVGSPDYAERHRHDARQINVEGTANVLEECQRHGSTFIYISSNGIYDGDKAPYSEKDQAKPINFYGKLKLEGEWVASSGKTKNAVVRPILMYGWHHSFGRSNIVTMALSRLEKGQRVFVYDDVFVSPLFAQDCARSIWVMVQKDIYETFNIGGVERSSIYQLVRKAAEVFGFDEGLVIPVKQGYFNELVKRPRDTSFDTKKMQSILGIKPISIDGGLKLMKKTRGL